MCETCDVLIVGGGFYGLYLASFLAKQGERVRLVEQGSELMQRASYSNQARVHGGYHYPRSMLTAGRSRANYPRFIDEFRKAISDSFTAIYAIPRLGSLVTAEQFAAAMQRIGAPIRRARAPVRDLFDAARIDDVFQVEETAFDSTKLRDMLIERAEHSGVEITLNTRAARVSRVAGVLRIQAHCSGGEEIIEAGRVIVCGYSQTNAIAAASGLPIIPLKHELAEMALIEVPVPLREIGITVMDGPFFSCMPFPPRGLHTLSHVRYTPHGQWIEGPGECTRQAYEIFDAAEKRSAFPHMMRDAARFVPSLARCEYRGSLWEVKTVLPRSEADDSRPILFRANHGLPGFDVVMGGKIDNIYDVAAELTRTLATQRFFEVPACEV